MAEVQETQAEAVAEAVGDAQPESAPVVTEPDVEPAGEPRKGPPATVPYDALKASRDQLKRERQLLREERKLREELQKQHAATQSQEPLPEDPVARVEAIVARGVSNSPLATKVAQMQGQLASQAAAQNAESFWKQDGVDPNLRSEVDTKYQIMVQRAAAMGQQPMFSREDIYDYELGRQTRQNRAAGKAVAAQTRQSQETVKKAASCVAGAVATAPKPSAPHKPLEAMTKAELLAQYGDVQF